MASVLVVALLLACNAPSRDGLYSRSGAGGALATSGAGGSNTGPGGSDAGGNGGGSSEDLGGADASASGAAGGSGSERDAGSDAGDGTPPSEAGAAPACGGTLLNELCWYLGELGDSCEDTCAERGGYDDRGTPFIGSEAQGGSLEQCTVLLEALLGTQADTDDENDSVGVGCHMRGEDEDRVWLDEPDFAPDESQSEARIACSCSR